MKKISILFIILACGSLQAAHLGPIKLTTIPEEPSALPPTVSSAYGSALSASVAALGNPGKIKNIRIHNGSITVTYEHQEGSKKIIKQVTTQIVPSTNSPR